MSVKSASLKIEPLFIEPTAVVLVNASAKRDLSVGFDGPGRAEISFSVDSSEFADDEYFVSTTYEISLRTQGKSEGTDVVANLASTYLITFRSDADTSSMADAGVLKSLQLAACEALHPYHRELLTQISERFDIPAYRLDVAFDRDVFIEEIHSVEFQPI